MSKRAPLSQGSGAPLSSAAGPVAEPAPAAVRARTLALLDQRPGGATICPSEIARSLAGDDGDWRALMPPVHRVIDALVSEGAVSLSWKRRALAERAGPYRIALGKEQNLAVRPTSTSGG